MKNNVYNFLEKSISTKRLAHSYLITTKDKPKKVIEKISMIILGVGDKVNVNKILKAERLIIYPNEKSVIEKKEIGKILNFSRLKPIFGTKRLVFIESAHLLTLPAANNLLKIIEEPPSYLTFFLLTPKSEKIITTILSRCIRLRMEKSTLSLSEENKKKYQELEKANLNQRFVIAEKLVKQDKLKLEQFLNDWLEFLGEKLRKSTKEGVVSIIEQIRKVEKTKTILERTYINPRLAIERLFINL